MPFYHLELTAAKPRPDRYPQDPETVGEHLRKARMDRGLLQQDVAERIGVYPDTVSNWEQGRSEPAIRQFPALIEFLGYVPFEIGDLVPERIRAYRKIHGLSKRRFAERLGVDEAPSPAGSRGGTSRSPSTGSGWRSSSSSPDLLETIILEEKTASGG